MEHLHWPQMNTDEHGYLNLLTERVLHAALEAWLPVGQFVF